MKHIRYTVDLLLKDACPVSTATFRYPIAWNAQSKPTHFSEVRMPVATCAVHKTKDGFIHVLRVNSLRIPPLQT